MLPAEVRFGDFLLRPAARELLAGSQAQRLGERAFDLLLALVEAEGAVVSREALFERAWPGRAVLDDNLKVQIMALRRVLGAAAVLTVPGRGYRLALAVGAAPAPPPPEQPGPAALYGREQELAALQRLLATARLVTLVGAGGIGKTRLARAAAAAAGGSGSEADSDSGNGNGNGCDAAAACFVELAALDEARLIVPAVARALALPPAAGEAALFAVLRTLELLLVLDNAEHLLDGVAAFAAAVLAQAPRVTLLVTSQEPLKLEAECVLRLEGLATPADDSAAAVAASPAAALFLARARAGTPELQAGPDLAPDMVAPLAQICRRLDGIPLALELAAARVPLLGVAGVQRKLDEALPLLTRGARDAPARQQTLRAALQWSHALLDAAQKAVFRRLAVFAGSFDLAAAQHVAAAEGLDDWAVADALQGLLDKSLLQLQAQGDTRRFRLPEAARQFALERLDDAGESRAARRRQAEAALVLFSAADARYTATATLPWLQPLLPELPNLRAAMHWALDAEGDEGLAIALCGAAGGFWALAGADAEAGAPLRRLAAQVDARWPVATQALFWLALSNRGGDLRFSAQETFEAAERAVALARAAGLNGLLHRALGHRLPLAQRAGVAIDVAATAAEMRAIEGDDWNALQRRPRRTCEAFEWYRAGDWARSAAAERLEWQLLREAGDLYRAWFAAHRLALAETALGRPQAAVEVMQQAVAEIRAHGMQRHCWQQVAMLAMTGIEAGAAPVPVVHEAVRLLRGAGAMGWMASHLAEWLAQQQRADDAARVLGWLARRQAERGEAPNPHGERAAERTRAALVRLAVPERVDACQREGELWSDDDVAMALLASPP